MTTLEKNPLGSNEQASPKAALLLDADVHPTQLPNRLLERLQEPWRSRLARTGTRVPPPTVLYPRLRNGGSRVDSFPEEGPPGSDPVLMRRQLLDEYGLDYAILIPLSAQGYGAESAGFASALCRAVNEWISEDWLDQDARLRATLNVPLEHPEDAVREIERYASDRRFVQVLLSGNMEAQVGDRKYWPIYEAAADAGLPVAAHVGGFDSHHSGTGWPSFYIEEHLWLHSTLQGIAMSMICEGLFEHVPSLQVALVEGGISWAGPLQWAMDHAYSFMPEEMGHLQAMPSEYFREHFWFTTQPIEEPDDPALLVQAFEMTQMTDHIMFSSDYPHWDFDSPLLALPASLPNSLRSRIMGENACRLYGLDEESGVRAS